jgi:hypothetical protein
MLPIITILGKFYELYEKDAEIGQKEFDLKLTERVNMKMVEFIIIMITMLIILKQYVLHKKDYIKYECFKSMNFFNYHFIIFIIFMDLELFIDLLLKVGVPEKTFVPWASKFIGLG